MSRYIVYYQNPSINKNENAALPPKVGLVKISQYVQGLRIHDWPINVIINVGQDQIKLLTLRH